MFKSIYTTIITNIQKSLGKDSGWVIDSVTDDAISISRDNPLAGKSYIKLFKGLDHPKKGLITFQNTDNNVCFKWCLVRYLNPADLNTERITKTNKYMAKRLNFKDIKFPVKAGNIHKIEKKKNSISISGSGYENKVKHPVHVSKNALERNMLTYY